MTLAPRRWDGPQRRSAAGQCRPDLARKPTTLGGRRVGQATAQLIESRPDLVDVHPPIPALHAPVLLVIRRLRTGAITNRTWVCYFWRLVISGLTLSIEIEKPRFWLFWMI